MSLANSALDSHMRVFVLGLGFLFGDCLFVCLFSGCEEILFYLCYKCAYKVNIVSIVGFFVHEGLFVPLVGQLDSWLGGWLVFHYGESSYNVDTQSNSVPQWRNPLVATKLIL